MLFMEELTILIVEDNIFMAELLAEKIFNSGYEAISVYDGKEALEKIKQKPENIRITKR